MESEGLKKGENESTCFQALRSCTLRITFVLVIGFGLCVSGLVVYYEVYGPKLITGSQGDITLKRISTSYCKEVDISSADNQTYFNAYVVKGTPEISSRRLLHNNARTFYMPSWSYQYWSFYLLKGSVVDVYICADQYIMYYVIKGQKSFHEWKQTTLYRGYKQVKRLFPKKDCQSKSSFDHFSIGGRDTKDSDFYHILLSSSVGWRFYTKVSLVTQFDRSVYNTSNAILLCSNFKSQNSTCSLQLKYSSDDSVIIEHTAGPGRSPDMFEKSCLHWHPIARLTYYSKFFGGIFLVIVSLTALYTVSRCIAKKVSKSQYKEPVTTERKSIYAGTMTGSKRRLQPTRRHTRTSVVSYEVVSQSEVEEDEERNLTQLNEEFNASLTYSTTDQVRDMSMTAAGISAI